MSSIPSDSSLHVVLFPFMAKGHTIPILHLARLLLCRGAAVTIFTTPANRPFIAKSLSTTATSIVDLPFPENIPGVPAGVESAEKLPSMSVFVPFVTSTKLMKPHFEQTLETLPFVTFMISDAFLSWTLDSASKFNIPRMVFSAMSNFALTMTRVVIRDRLFSGVNSDDELVTVTPCPWIKLTKNDFEPVFTDPEPRGPHFQFIVEQVIATSKSYGLIANSFMELEPIYVEYWDREIGPKSWCVGPFCLAEPPPAAAETKSWIRWLDQKLAQGNPVLYVAFGSQAEISVEQFEEIKIGLEKSEANFLWVVRGNGSGLGDGFEERVRDRGMVVREWVDQREILGHGSVEGFLSHCGWNSVAESICAKVPILAWPMMADNPLNARMVTEEIKVGLRVKSVMGFVEAEGLEKMVRELMEGEKGKEVRKKVRELGEAAIKAVEEGGSSWQTLNELVQEIHAKRHL